MPPAGNIDAVGLDRDVEEIKNRLCGDPNELQILPIAGTGGIGKTTLARNVYHDPLIVESFSIRAWATVSQNYSFGNIFSSLLASMKDYFTGEETSGLTDREMAEKVYRTLFGRKYLIVIDDMWSTKTWDEIRFYFPDSSNGSRLMLTTRLEDVAAYADSSKHFHRMQFMGDDQSLSLLQKEVCKGNCRLPMSETMQKIAAKIAKSCGGLPLAIVVIAGLLSEVGEGEAVWDQIASNINLAVTADEDNYVSILSLSYTNLPEKLRKCFLYMGAFPDDQEIHVSKLIRLWIAEGFVESSAASTKSPEDAAEECLEDLVKRNLVLVRKRKSNGRIKSCGLHGLLRDLCLIKSLEENFLLYFMGKYVLPEIFEDQRRVSISYSECLVDIDASTIHTIICFQKSEIASLDRFELLILLDMAKAKLPAHVFELLHLKYLALSSPTAIPATISNLHDLETLVVYPAEELVTLPSEIWEMSSLRHLISSLFHSLPHPDGASPPLESLQTLSIVANFVCSERMVQMIPNIKKLGIYYSGEKLDEDYHLENLKRLDRLEKLKMEIRSDVREPRLDPVFPEFLKKLTLSGGRRPWEDLSVVVDSLPNLQVLKLRNYACDGSIWETSDGDFKELMFLLIEGSDLEEWSTESSHFPKLKSLVLRQCPTMRKIPGDIGNIQSLELIEVDGRNQDLVDSAKSIKLEQEMDYENYGIQVRY